MPPKNMASRSPLIKHAWERNGATRCSTPWSKSDNLMLRGTNLRQYSLQSNSQERLAEGNLAERPSSDDLAWASIDELAPRIANGDVSPIALTELMLSRIESVDRKLRAYAEVWAEDAIENATDATAEIESGTYRGPLHGIPIALKDLVDVKGKRTAGGSMVLENNIASQTATVANRLTDAGAIVLGKTNLVEFAFGPTGVNTHTGTVANPWDTRRVTGGSSSGSGASVAAGCAFGAIGSDTGGSIRMPASICGIAGLKPTYGLVPRTGVLDLSWSQDHVGPMTRRTVDCAHFLNAIAGPDDADFTAARRASDNYAEGIREGLNGLKLGLPEHYFFDTDIVAPEVAQAVHDAVQLMANNGAEIVPITTLEFVADGRPINVVISLAEAAAVHQEMLATSADEYTDMVRSRMLPGFEVSAVDYIHAQRARRHFAHAVATAMADIDALVTPTIPVPTPTIAECTPDVGSSVAGKGAELPLLTSIFDVTGQPSLSVNCGFDRNGMPIGLMITAAAFNDKTALRVGHAYEELAGWHRKRPPVDRT